MKYVGLLGCALGLLIAIFIIVRPGGVVLTERPTPPGSPTDGAPSRAEPVRDAGQIRAGAAAFGYFLLLTGLVLTKREVLSIAASIAGLVAALLSSASVGLWFVLPTVMVLGDSLAHLKARARTQ